VRITIKNAISARNIDEHDTRIEELIALVADHAVARAAFEEAVRRRPGKLITLRQKSRVLADSHKSLRQWCGASPLFQYPSAPPELDVGCYGSLMSVSLIGADPELADR
jgi:hypothetical protein